jgi:hypothetical protein
MDTIHDSKSGNKNKRKNNNHNNEEVPTKKPFLNSHIIFNDEVEDDEDGYEYLKSLIEIAPEVKEEDKELVEIDKEIKCLQDLIDLGKMYDSTKRIILI